MRILLLSDIHGNLGALRAVYEKASSYRLEGCLLLGDLIDYGMRSNEVVEEIKASHSSIKCNIWGNHEEAVFNGNYARFSTDRGRESARYIRDSLSKNSWDYLRNSMVNKGRVDFVIGQKRCLAVHGSIQDEYWGSITPDTDAAPYAEYDYVFSGHSHKPHFFEKYIDVSNPVMRNKKKIIFINPGSVGQPRNHNNMAQYAVFDTETEEIILGKAAYDIEGEQAFYHGEVDDFYRERLRLGI